MGIISGRRCLWSVRNLDRWLVLQGDVVKLRGGRGDLVSAFLPLACTVLLLCPSSGSYCVVCHFYPIRCPSGALLARQDLKVLALPTPIFFLIVTNRTIFNMTPRKSYRVRKPRKIWEQKKAPSTAKDPKITKKTSHMVEKTAFKPIATGPLPKTVGFDADHLPDLPTYKPPLDHLLQIS